MENLQILPQCQHAVRTYKSMAADAVQNGKSKAEIESYLNAARGVQAELAPLENKYQSKEYLMSLERVAWTTTPHQRQSTEWP